MKKSITFLNKYIDNETIVIGVSGGPDSMALLDIIINNFKKTKIIVAHVNHNVREESRKEQKFVKEYCLNHNVFYEDIILPKEKKVSEANLRKKRYSFFESIIIKYNASYLITAHHNDDLIETILMRINRGSTLKGYAGIELCTDKKIYKILRPLLYCGKEEIIEYINKNNIPYVIDNSNNEDKYTRNRYRHNILPFLKAEVKNIEDKYLKYSEELLDYHRFVNNIVLEKVKKNYKNKIYNLDDFNNQDDLIKRKIIECLLDINYPTNLDLICNKHVLDILNLINGKSNGMLNLPDNKIIEKSYNELRFKKQEEIINFDYILKNKVDLENGIIYITDDDSDNSNYCLKISSQEVSLPIHVRSRKNGDKMSVKNLNGSKKIKDILIDEKIKISKRTRIPIVVDDNNVVLWIPGVKKSKFDKSNTKNYDIIIKYSEFMERKLEDE